MGGMHEFTRSQGELNFIYHDHQYSYFLMDNYVIHIQVCDQEAQCLLPAIATLAVQ